MWNLVRRATAKYQHDLGSHQDYKVSPIERSWRIPCRVGPFCSRAEMSCRGDVAEAFLPVGRQKLHLKREAAFFCHLMMRFKAFFQVTPRLLQDFIPLVPS